MEGYCFYEEVDGVLKMKRYKLVVSNLKCYKVFVCRCMNDAFKLRRFLRKHLKGRFVFCIDLLYKRDG